MVFLTGVSGIIRTFLPLETFVLCNVHASSTEACPFCQHPLDYRQRCMNVRCSSHQFAAGNLVRSVANKQWDLGRVTKVYKEQSSKGPRDVVEVQFVGYNFQLMYPPELIHEIFPKGSQVLTDIPGMVTIDSEPQIEKGVISYQAVNDAGHTIDLPESLILHLMKAIPQMLQESEFSSIEAFRLRTWARYLECTYSSTDIKCITNSRLELLPHQVFVAHRLISNFRPRFILADEVGLGKTIEAGIVIKELIARELIRRVLIIVPAQLVYQWQFEMQSKFNERFDIFDATLVHRIRRERPGENPWLASNRIICSLQYTRKEKVTSEITELFWDAVIFDEAHHLRRYIGATGYPRPTLSYQLADKLQERCNILLLLTATPIQLNPYELYSLIRLIDVAHFRNFEEFEEFRKHLPTINMLIKNVLEFQNLSKFEEEATLREIQEFIFQKKGKTPPPAKLREVILHEPTQRRKILAALSREHTLSNIMIRNKKRSVLLESGPKILRNPHIIEILQTQQEKEVYGAIRLFLAKTYNKAISEKNQGLGFVVVVLQKLLSSSTAALISTLQKRVDALRAFQQQIEEAKTKKKRKEALPKEIAIEGEEEADGLDAVEEDNDILTKTAKFEFDQIPVLEEFIQELKRIPEDSKTRMLKKLIKKIFKDPSEKVLVFTQFRKTLEVIEQALAQDYKVVTFHGGLSAEEKSVRVELFREQCQIMISTEVGGEGRNFQFCHILINFDLPWNPMKLEQRIGRLDRFGQKRDVDIYNFYIADTVETNILLALAERIQLFEETIGGLEPILGEVSKSIRDIVLMENEASSYSRIREFNEEMNKKLEQAKDIELKMADFLLDRRSFQMNKVGELLACHIEVTNNEVWRFFKDFSQKYFKNNIINEEPDKALTLSLPENALVDFPSVRGRRTFHGTFDLDLAKRKEELEFFALGHPLLTDALYYCKRPEFGGFTTASQLSRNVFRGILEHTPSQFGILWNYYIEFAGVIVERELRPVFVDAENNGTIALGETIFQLIRQNPLALQPCLNEDFSNINLKAFVNNAEGHAKQIVAQYATTRVPELEKRNTNAFELEKRKYERLKEFTHDNLVKDIERARLERQAAYARRPTDKQIRETEALPFSSEKEKKLADIQARERRIEQAEKRAKELELIFEKKEFDYEDELRRLGSYKHLQVKIELYTSCLIKLVD